MASINQRANQSDSPSNVCLDQSFQAQELPIREHIGLKSLGDNQIQIHNTSGKWIKAYIFGSFLFMLVIVIIQGINFFKLKDFQTQPSQIETNQTSVKPESVQNGELILSKIQKMEEDVLKIEAQLQQKQKPESVQNGELILSKIQKMEEDVHKIETQLKEKQNQKSIKFKLRQRKRENFPENSITKDYYEFNISSQELVKKNTNPFLDKNTIILQGIKYSELERAIKLLEVVHNVNFKGEFVFDHYNFYSSPEAKALALSKVLQEEKDYYDKKYEINKYSKDQIGICVFVPSYNNAKNRLYLRNLDSIFQQEYQNYHVVYVNDASTDGTGEYVKLYMEENEIPPEKYVIINNEKHQGNLPNHVNAAFNHCKEGQIMIFMDGDDSLIGRQAFSLLNAVYRTDKVALTYGQFIQINQDNDNLISLKMYSHTIPQKALKQGTFRSLKGFYTSHLKTMYVDVSRQIRDDDFRDKQGKIFQTYSDVAFMTPAIEMVGQRLKFITQFIYQYRFGTGNNDASELKKYVFDEIMAKVPHKKLQSMPFADNPKTIHYL